jgi:hypothetical protein
MLESLEDRLVPSTVVPKIEIPLHASALTTGTALHTDGTGDGIVANPEAVHGYKWRGRRWWPYQVSSGAEVYTFKMAEPSHLVKGGNEGPTVSISMTGEYVIHLPEGPLPTEAVAKKR